jgi:phage repressor protein C with HTH and peptisase S24 domain
MVAAMFQHAVPIVDPEETVPGAWLEAALEEKGRSGAWLYKKLGVDPTSVSRWRNGKTPISRSRWMAIAAALDLPQGWSPSTSGSKPQ